MNVAIEYIRAELRKYRELSGLTTAALEEKLVFGPGWIKAFEEGDVSPSVDILMAILKQLRIEPAEFFRSAPVIPDGFMPERALTAERAGRDVIVHFRYAKHDAKYRLLSTNLDTFNSVLKALRDGLARLATRVGTPSALEDETSLEKAIKTEAVAFAFLKAVHVWPHINPSDVWWFIISRAYGDPFNHPALFSRLNHEQS